MKTKNGNSHGSAIQEKGVIEYGQKEREEKEVRQKIGVRK
jgi:hypothetical protein